ncbi:MAG: helix-hairpin-helix domain-containing protein, partial [Verrucomicrobiota bacterium]
EYQGGNLFRIRAYRNASRTIGSLVEPLAQVRGDPHRRLEDLEGIGADLAEKIIALLDTATFPLLRELEQAVPRIVFDLMRIPGLGPKKIKALVEALRIDSLDALESACREGRVAGVKGFGEKTQATILANIAFAKDPAHDRLLWRDADAIVQELLAWLRACPAVDRIEGAGSWRRGRETVGDLDLVVASSRPAEVMDRLVAWPGMTAVMLRGDTKISIRGPRGVQVDLRVVDDSAYGAALQYFTGSKEHNVAMRHRALGRGLSMSEWGFKSVDEKTPAPGATSEEEVFRALGLPWIPPELREGNGEIDAAEAGRLPKLVQFADLRGVFHNHTTESDGDHTLDQMAAAAEAHGWEYLGISDHSKSSFQAGGLDEARLAKQLADIAQLNASQKYRVRVLAGSEVDILKDGALDFPD